MLKLNFLPRLGLLLCCLPLLMGAQVYRWIDENGVVNYTQLKPEGVESELVSSDSGRAVTSAARSTPAAAGASPADGGEPSLSDRQQAMLRDLQAAEQARKEEFERVRADNCQRARDVLSRLSERGRIRVRGEDGQERMMTEEERQQRIDEAQRGVAANCD
ncbi:MAG: DUF4124 domain-containing protein [Pseudomonadales bacterium]